MKATVTKKFRGAEDGSRETQTFKPGAQIEGDLARAMVEAGFAREATSTSRARSGVSNKGPSDGGTQEPGDSAGTGASSGGGNVVRRGRGSGRKRKQPGKK